ncbi:PTS sugar transporter subunit IIA [Pediococcus claussenii]|uniref:Mannitol-specific phosphotransferase enzyme IIA component n=1 Tax=Pediococcus claussenii (strain ATCC BAA-344 / DSM 14800 / JCM 18046 / KCTC 3811 / LMG 21948 / P06) TaxID=701521 RepID=G8PBL3_PEDCP|nr:PTS sugar transporter subunit IIA [Pediococcus claussenii]AEV94762.1 mannitol-specific phosphotransferase enzyme IIA component [Pediococcus claussenii ATCC BAA-344]ANZ69958.1 PTS mannitol transporter subunit IIA [Pediococcus claussenii]ANZ71774.1 PTS mannitol transporter subunit IIA [Pediococcus claussenii]KRN20941.1 mtlF protein [Pediococcus claussenii]
MQALEENMILLDQHVATKEEAIRLAGQLLVDGGCAEPEYIESMQARNRDVSVYMGNFIAIPHGTDDGKRFIKKTGISIVQVPMGVDFSGDDEQDEKLVTVVFGIAGLNGEHLDILSKIAIFCSDINNVVKLADAQTKDEIISLLKNVD